MITVTNFIGFFLAGILPTIGMVSFALALDGTKRRIIFFTFLQVIILGLLALAWGPDISDIENYWTRVKIAFLPILIWTLIGAYIIRESDR